MERVPFAGRYDSCFGLYRLEHFNGWRAVRFCPAAQNVIGICLASPHVPNAPEEDPCRSYRSGKYPPSKTCCRSLDYVATGDLSDVCTTLRIRGVFYAPSIRPPARPSVRPPFRRYFRLPPSSRQRWNSAYSLASQLAMDVRDHTSGVRRQEGGEGAAPSGGDQPEANLWRPLVALVVAVVAAWLLRGTAPPFSGARGRKRVKVN